MKEVYESGESLSLLNSCHDGYYDYGHLETESTTLAEFRRALARLEKCFQKGDVNRTILDVGYGNGLFLALAKQAILALIHR